MSASQILVTGGTGVLGRRVVERLGSAGIEARVFSRSGRPGTIVHCASSPFRKARQTDVEGTRRLLEAAARAGVSHIVYISIVGIDPFHLIPTIESNWKSSESSRALRFRTPSCEPRSSTTSSLWRYSSWSGSP
jgi:nucleoside-diphosphate-sugar epimerase